MKEREGRLIGRGRERMKRKKERRGEQQHYTEKDPQEWPDAKKLSASVFLSGLPGHNADLVENVQGGPT